MRSLTSWTANEDDAERSAEVDRSRGGFLVGCGLLDGKQHHRAKAGDGGDEPRIRTVETPKIATDDRRANPDDERDRLPSATDVGELVLRESSVSVS